MAEYMVLFVLLGASGVPNCYLRSQAGSRLSSINTEIQRGRKNFIDFFIPSYEKLENNLE
jgi:hypothetical protein